MDYRLRRVENLISAIGGGMVVQGVFAERKIYPFVASVVRERVEQQEFKFLVEV